MRGTSRQIAVPGEGCGGLPRATTRCFTCSFVLGQSGPVCLVQPVPKRVGQRVQWSARTSVLLLEGAAGSVRFG